MNYRFGQGQNPQHSVFYSHHVTMSGIPIGTLQSLTMRQTRAAERIREVNAERGPVVKEIVWGGNDIEIDITRFEIYDNNIFTSMGIASVYDMYTLDNVNFRFDIVEIQYRPNSNITPGTRDLATVAQRVVIYEQCVPTSFTKTLDLGTIHVIESMTCYVTRIAVNSGSATLNYPT